jgi:GNAT superfamily N-acetyltransferase
MAEIVIREATAADAPSIHALVQALAEFERAPDAVRATPADFLREGFGERPSFRCLLAEVDGRAAGFALWFYNFSTWEGRRGIYLEDVYIDDWARGMGIGERLMRRLAATAVDEGCARLDLWVLHWNPARRFYERLGMQQMEEWLPYRLTGDALRRLAEPHPPASSRTTA